MNKIFLVFILGTFTLDGMDKPFDVTPLHQLLKKSDEELFRDPKKLLEQEMVLARIITRTHYLTALAQPVCDNFESESSGKESIIDHIQFKMNLMNTAIVKIIRRHADLEKMVQQEEAKELEKQQFDHVDKQRKEIITGNTRYLVTLSNALDQLEETIKTKGCDIFCSHFLMKLKDIQNGLRNASMHQEMIKTDLKSFSTMLTDKKGDANSTPKLLEQFLNFFIPVNNLDQMATDLAEQYVSISGQYRQIHSLATHVNSQATEVSTEILDSLSHDLEELSLMDDCVSMYKTQLQLYIDQLYILIVKVIADKKSTIKTMLSKKDLIEHEPTFIAAFANYELFSKIIVEAEKAGFLRSLPEISFQEFKNQLKIFLLFLQESQKAIIEKNSEYQVSLNLPSSHAVSCIIISSTEIDKELEKYPFYHCKKSKEQSNNIFEGHRFSHLFFLSKADKKITKQNSEKKNSKKSLTPVESLEIKSITNKGIRLDIKQVNSGSLVLLTANSGESYFIDKEKDPNNAYHLDCLAFIKSD